MKKNTKTKEVKKHVKKQTKTNPVVNKESISPTIESIKAIEESLKKPLVIKPKAIKKVIGDAVSPNMTVPLKIVTGNGILLDCCNEDKVGNVAEEVDLDSKFHDDKYNNGNMNWEDLRDDTSVLTRDYIRESTENNLKNYFADVKIDEIDNKIKEVFLLKKLKIMDLVSSNKAKKGRKKLLKCLKKNIKKTYKKIKSEYGKKIATAMFSSIEEELPKIYKLDKVEKIFKDKKIKKLQKEKYAILEGRELNSDKIEAQCPRISAIDIVPHKH